MSRFVLIILEYKYLLKISRYRKCRISCLRIHQIRESDKLNKQNNKNMLGTVSTPHKHYKVYMRYYCICINLINKNWPIATLGILQINEGHIPMDYHFVLQKNQFVLP